jgi:hypothetical protein
MAHLRQQIRDRVVTDLTGLSTTGSNVFRSRIYPLESGKLPGLCIFTKSETTEYDTINIPRSITRTLEIGVEAYVKATSNYDNTLDTIAVEVEEALAGDVTLNDLVKDSKITSFESDYSGDGEQPIAIGRFTIEALYRAKENDVETAI